MEENMKQKIKHKTKQKTDQKPKSEKNGSDQEVIMPSILLIEDNPSDERLIRIMVAEIWGNTIPLRHAERLGAGIALIEEQKSDVILLDLGLPDSLGLESVEKFCRIVPEIPVIVLTGLDDDTTGNEAVRKGAQDYLIKSQFDGRALKKAIKYAIERKRWDRTREQLIRELQEALNKIKVLKGLIPICACCKSIRNDKGFWERIESYIRTHSDVEFTHSICPDCEKKYYSDLSDAE
ncbi:MAG: response regulator [Vulcanimicrobiota bacterium]